MKELNIKSKNYKVKKERACNYVKNKKVEKRELVNTSKSKKVKIERAQKH
jgi:hypothetical protein